MATHDEPSRTEQELRAVLQGAPSVLAGGKTISFGGKSYDLASFTQAIEALLAPYVNVRQQRTLLEKAVEERRSNADEANRFMKILKHEAVASFGEESVEFTLLGFKPKKKPVELTPEQKQHKLEQLRATRAVRHTMGKRQKQSVKGVVSSNGTQATQPAKPVKGPTP